MVEDYPYYIVISVCSAVITGILAWSALRHRGRTAAPELAWLMAGLTGWSLAPALVQLAGTVESAYVLARLLYVFPIAVPVLWIRFTNEYVKGQASRMRIPVRFLWIVPAVSLVLVWTDPWHHLFWRSLSFYWTGHILQWNASFGPGFWLHSVYSYGLMLAGLVVIIRYSFSAFTVYRLQTTVVLIGCVTPLLMSLPAVLGMTTLTFTPLGIAVTGVAFTWGVLRSRMLVLRPIARNLLIDQLHDGMVVLDPEGNIVDLNRAALELIGASEKEIIGASGGKVLQHLHLTGLDGASENHPSGNMEIEVLQNGKRAVFNVYKTVLTGPNGQGIGELVHFHDITRLKDVESALRASEARARAIVDALPDQVLLIDPEGNYAETIHPSAADFDRNALTPKFSSIFDRFPPATASAILETVQATIRSKTNQMLTYRITGADDEWWYEARTAPLQEETGQVTQVVWIDREITQQMMLYHEVEHLANTDELTGLANRRRFFSAAEEMLEQHIRNQGTCSLILIDIDHFKDFNDAYGHQTGDEVLQVVARRIAHNLREGDLVARYGGEEFIIFLPGSGNEAARDVADRLRQAIANEPFILRNVEARISISIGVVCTAACPCCSIEQLVDKADAALYEAKRAGRNTVMVNG